MPLLFILSLFFHPNHIWEPDTQEFSLLFFILHSYISQLSCQKMCCWVINQKAAKRQGSSYLVVWWSPRQWPAGAPYVRYQQCLRTHSRASTITGTAFKHDLLETMYCSVLMHKLLPNPCWIGYMLQRMNGGFYGWLLKAWRVLDCLRVYACVFKNERTIIVNVHAHGVEPIIKWKAPVSDYLLSVPSGKWMRACMQYSTSMPIHPLRGAVYPFMMLCTHPYGSMFVCVCTSMNSEDSGWRTTCFLSTYSCRQLAALWT